MCIFDKLDDINDKTIHICSTMKYMPVDLNSSIYFDFN